jgi:hypothetical protein
VIAARSHRKRRPTLLTSVKLDHEESKRISTTDYTDFTDIFAGFFLIRAIRVIRG